MNYRQPYRAAIIGLGNIGFMFDLETQRRGTWSHAKAYTRCPWTELVGAVEVDRGKAALFREHYPDVPVYDRIDRLLMGCRPDIVSVCTPTWNHYPLIKDLLSYPLQGIFCEKPLAATAAEGEEIVRQCAIRGIVLVVNHTRRWDPCFQVVKEMVQCGQLGGIRAIHAIYPGQVFNIGTHMLDVVRMVTGRTPVIVSGVDQMPGEDDPHLSGWLRFDNDAVCTVNALGRRELLVFELDFIGNLGRVKIIDNGEGIEFFSFEKSTRYGGYEELKRQEITTPAWQDRLVEAVADLVQVISGTKAEVNCTGADGLVALRLVEALVASAQRGGHPVAISSDT